MTWTSVKLGLHFACYSENCVQGYRMRLIFFYKWPILIVWRSSGGGGATIGKKTNEALIINVEQAVFCPFIVQL